jgi:hypothetical protein
MATQPKIVYLMRGLPSCGKSHTARRLAGNAGIVLETDEYFYIQVGDVPRKYDYRDELLSTARDWNFDRFRSAIATQHSPIVIDRGNGLNPESKRYAEYAVENGYSDALREPDSTWWQEIRILLKHKDQTGEILEEWADVLAAKSRKTHRVPKSTIRRWMDKWLYDLTIDEILKYGE